MRLILIRHGESEWNREGRILGRADAKLSEFGRRQGQAVAMALQGEKIEAVYCSPLKRAMETGRMISSVQRCPLISDPTLQELGRGNLEGMTRQEAFRVYPDLQRTWPEVSGTAGVSGHESLEELDLRVRTCVDRIRARHRQDTVALVGHYFVNLTIILRLLGMKLQSLRSFAQDIGAISIVEIEKGRSRICLFNHSCHLEKV